MKRSPLKRKSKSETRQIQDALWQECRRIVFEQYGKDCYTCIKKNLEGRNLHCGHMWPKASVGAYLKYSINILRPQCYFCNVNLGGNGAVFYKRMLREEGKPYMDKLESDRQVTVKASDYYAKLLEEYRLLKK